MRLAIKKYKKLYADSPLPDAGVTLNIYTQTSYAHAAMLNLSQFSYFPEAKKDMVFAVWKTASMVVVA